MNASATLKSELSFTRVIGNLSAKRAIEVAAVAAASMIIKGPHGAQKGLIANAYAELYPSRLVVRISVSDRPEELRQRLADHGDLSDILLLIPNLPELKRETLVYLKELLDQQVLIVATVQHCPCGNLNSRVRGCSCDLETVQRYRSRIPFGLLDACSMLVESDEPTCSDIMARQNGFDSGDERIDAVLARVKKASPAFIARREPIPLKMEAIDLLDTAVRCLSLSTVAVENIRKLTTAITYLESTSYELAPAHCVAEAIQYVMKNN
ncbi:MAG: hypothetical protein C0402_05535 [Thermodesulfovibrio sp.]|nr:hypothetical protein [Thermodesulfovibrio sp.]